MTDDAGDESTNADSESTEVLLRRRAQMLADQSPDGVLATLDDDGYPYTSFVELIFDGDRHFWFLLSDLAPHTSYIDRDERASLLLRESAADDEQALEATRGSYRGQIVECDDCSEEIESQYLEAHPHARQYIEFTDFSFYRFAIERVRMVGGFGKVGWVQASEMGG